MRKGGGLVRLVAGEVETRRADVEASWEGVNDESDEDENNDEEIHDEEGEGDGEDGEEDEDVEMDGEEDEDEEEMIPLVPTKNHKQASSKLTAPPALIRKRVTFAAKPKEPRSTRKAGSLKKVQAKPVVRATKMGGPRAANVGPKKVSQQSSSEGAQTYDFAQFF